MQNVWTHIRPVANKILQPLRCCHYANIPLRLGQSSAAVGTETLVQEREAMKRDIHTFSRRLQLIEISLKKDKKTRKDLTTINQFRDRLLADGLGLARVVKYLQALRAVYIRVPCRILKATRTQMISNLASIEREELSAWTKHDYKITLRKYLAFAGRQDLADLVRLPKVSNYKLPEELISQAEVLELLDTHGRIEDHAFIFVLWESGCRIGEVLSLQRKHVTMDAQGAIIIVDGKTGMRRVRLLESATVLDEWISCRSLKSDGYIFPNTYRSYSKRLQTLARRAGIDKRIYPHLFRHSRATFLANYLTEAQLCAHMGWTIGSAMPRIYVHLAGHDLDSALARIPTLLPVSSCSVAPAVRT